jgi:lysophospholipase L1-like esterase
MTWGGVVVFVFCGLAGLTSLARAQGLPSKQSNVGDSISQGFDANDLPSDHPELSWVQGTDGRVNAMFTRYVRIRPGFTQQPESVTGAELVGGRDNLAAQASRICAQRVRPQHVSILLGGNDVCNRPSSSSSNAAANMYSVATWTNALRAGLDQLSACLPTGSTAQVESVPRVDFLFEAGHQKSFWCAYIIWPAAHICRIVTGENNAGRRAQIGARINQYNDALRNETIAYNSNSNGRNPRRIRFVTDWVGSIESGHRNSSVGTYQFTANDINGVDCFHPNIPGQAKLACAGWAADPDGSGSIPACLR